MSDDSDIDLLVVVVPVSLATTVMKEGILLYDAT